jgi:hypothetical protein
MAFVKLQNEIFFSFIASDRNAVEGVTEPNEKACLFQVEAHNLGLRTAIGTGIELHLRFGLSTGCSHLFNPPITHQESCCLVFVGVRGCHGLRSISSGCRISIL